MLYFTSTSLQVTLKITSMHNINWAKFVFSLFDIYFNKHT